MNIGLSVSATTRPRVPGDRLHLGKDTLLACGPPVAVAEEHRTLPATHRPQVIGIYAVRRGALAASPHGRNSQPSPAQGRNHQSPAALAQVLA
jgi:hypothetical protein